MKNSSQMMSLLRSSGLFVYILLAGVFPWLILGTYGNLFEGFARRLIILLLIALIGSQIFNRLYRRWSGWASFALTILFYTSVYQISTFIAELSTYPLSLGWSETSRYYYASLFFSQRIYGIDAPPSVLHPTRYLMQAVPFLLENSPLWLHRLWQVFLWVSVTFLGAYSLLRRISSSSSRNVSSKLVKDRLFQLTFVMWAFLFFFQGPVYYHLMVMLILVLWGFNRERFWWSFVIVMLASLWAGISRLNWFPMPGLLASALYFLEVRTKDKSIWRYLTPPFLWTVFGIGAAMLAQQVYIYWSGNPPDQFTSSFTSDLLWYRLLPNPTYRLGILPGITLISLPLLGATAFQLYRYWPRYHIIRLLSLAVILFILFLGGVIVSLKIGGGSNLHNLDAYLVMLLVVGCYATTGAIHTDNLNEEQAAPIVGNKLIVAALIALPVSFSINSGAQISPPNMAVADEAIQTIRESIRERTDGDGEVLFISQRHLLTFGDIQGVQLIPEHEKVFLMEMAMAGSESYLNDFYADLERNRFDLIITDPLKIQYQGPSRSFGEENDAWVSRVSEPVLCYYEPLRILSEVETEILIPRDQPCR